MPSFIDKVPLLKKRRNFLAKTLVAEQIAIELGNLIDDLHRGTGYEGDPGAFRLGKDDIRHIVKALPLDGFVGHVTGNLGGNGGDNPAKTSTALTIWLSKVCGMDHWKTAYAQWETACKLVAIMILKESLALKGDGFIQTKELVSAVQGYHTHLGGDKDVTSKKLAFWFSIFYMMGNSAVRDRHSLGDHSPEMIPSVDRKNPEIFAGKIACDLHKWMSQEVIAANTARVAELDAQQFGKSVVIMAASR